MKDNRNHDGRDLLTSALAADALDVLGHRHQCLGPDIRPLVVGQRMVGRAFAARGQAAADLAPERPYEGLLAALDAVTAGSVFVFTTDRSDAAGVWGELVTTACQFSGVVGAITDGLVRDVDKVLELDFPVFGRGMCPYDSKGRIDVVAHGQPVAIDGVTISTGDLIVGDSDGVCVIPLDLEPEVLQLVAEKHSGEDAFRQAVSDGMSVTDAFRKFGVL